MNFILHNTLLARKFVALLLLSVFTLGITPKRTLHRLLANHKDSSSKTNNNKGTQLNVAGYNCKCDDLVAESSFISSTGFGVSIPFSYRLVFSSRYTSFISLAGQFFLLRGPPMKF